MICFLGGVLIVLVILFLAYRFGYTEPELPPEPELPKPSEPMLSVPERFEPPTVIYVPEPKPDPEPVRYELSDAERQLVCEVVMAESGNQPYCGQMAVAQCLLNNCERSDIRPADAVEVYQYTSNRVEPSESVRNAVAAVFDRGEVATDETILWFYAFKRTESAWHETQRHVLTINDHKFFAEKE
jgi:hypothetical protein